MRSILTVLFFVSLIATSCGKEESFEVGDPVDNSGGGGTNTGGGGSNTGGGLTSIPAGFHMIFKEDGQTREIKYSVTANKVSAAGLTSYFLVGLEDVNADNSLTLTFVNLTNSNALTTGTYKTKATVNSYIMAANYLKGDEDWSAEDLPPNSFQATISSVTATEITGTFSGKLSDENGTSKNITEGAFRCEVK